MAPATTPVWLVTGFLGAGKTTLLGQLAQRTDFGTPLFLINEWSALGIDQLLIPTASDQIKLLENGCLCCAWLGEMGGTLRGVFADRDAGKIPFFDRIVIETTGLADPVPIIRTLAGDASIASLTTLESVICLVDAVHGEAALKEQQEASKQLAIADTVLVSKGDLAGEEATAQVIQEVRRINPIARVRAVLHGRIELDAFARAAEVRDVINLPIFRDAGSRKSQFDLSSTVSKPRHDSSISSFTIVRDAPMSMAMLECWLALLLSLRGARLLRVKGLVNVEGQPIAVHAVQKIVHEPVALARWPSTDHRTRLVFITRGLAKEAIEQSLDAADKEIEWQVQGPIDAAAYEAFLKSAVHLTEGAAQV